MADITVTANSVAKGSGAETATGIAGAAITAGQVLYIDTSDSNKLKLADCDSTASLRIVAGIALNGAASGQPVTYQFGGNINPGGTVVVGTMYVLSATAGGIAPITDLTSTDYVCLLGIGTTASNIELNIWNTGVAVA